MDARAVTRRRGIGMRAATKTPGDQLDGWLVPQLQRRAGNAAVTALLQRRAGCGVQRACACGGSCPTCEQGEAMAADEGAYRTAPPPAHTLGLQRLALLAGNRAVCSVIADSPQTAVQRAVEDDPARLSSQILAGVAEVDAALHNSPPFAVGARDRGVGRLQGGLQAVGFPPGGSQRPDGTFDAVFGSGTRTAVVGFQGANHLKTDGVAGERTLQSLDLALLQAGDPAPAPDVGPSPAPDHGTDADAVARAVSERNAALASALPKLQSLQSRILASVLLQPGEGPPVIDDNDQVANTVSKWAYTGPDRPLYFDEVGRLIDIVRQSSLDTTKVIVPRPSAPPQDVTDCATNFAFVRGGSDNQIRMCPSVLDSNANCRREVLLHEYFHFIVGPNHHYDLAPAGKTSDTASHTQANVDTALDCPHHMAELVMDLAVGAVSGCTKRIDDDVR